MVLFWIIIIAALVMLAASLLRGTSARGARGGEEKPLDILKRRYARGDLTKDEFERMKKDIEV